MKPLRKPVFWILTCWKWNKEKAPQYGRINDILIALVFSIFTLFFSTRSSAQIVYVGNTFTNNGAGDTDPPLVILGEFSPTGPLNNSTVTLPAGVVQDVWFYGGGASSFTLYALAWVTNGPSPFEQTFQVVASEYFTNYVSVANYQTNLVTDFTVQAGDFLAFQGVGPYYVASTNGLDATYETPGNPYTAANPGSNGTTFIVGINGDASADYEYIPSDITLPSRTYDMGVHVLSTNGFTFYTLAGQGGNNGFVNGFGTNALFNNAEGTAVASNFDIFVADTTNNRIRKITTVITNWLVTTIAGSNGAGHTDGVGTNSQFNGPQGIAVTGNETVFVADTVNDTIRMLALTNNNWAVSTIAGIAGTTGSNNGTNVAGYFAKFNGPEGIAVDINTNVFVVDTTNDTIREIKLTNGNWVVATIAGLAQTPGHTDGSNSLARFDLPEGIAVDTADNLFVADSGNNEIRKVSPIGNNWVVTTIAGTNILSGTNDGTGTSARFNNPGGIAVDACDDLFVTDTSNDTVRAVVPWRGNWFVNTIGGLAKSTGYNNGVGAGARFTNPRGISVNSLGDLFVDETVVLCGFSPLSGAGSSALYTVQVVLGPQSVDNLGSQGAEWEIAGSGNWIRGQLAPIPPATTLMVGLTTTTPIVLNFQPVAGWAAPNGSANATLTINNGSPVVAATLSYESGCLLIVTNWSLYIPNNSLLATGTVGQTYTLQSNSLILNNEKDWYNVVPPVTFDFANAKTNRVTTWPPSPWSGVLTNVFYRAISQEQ